MSQTKFTALIFRNTYLSIAVINVEDIDVVALDFLNLGPVPLVVKSVLGSADIALLGLVRAWNGRIVVKLLSQVSVKQLGVRAMLEVLSEECTIWSDFCHDYLFQVFLRVLRKWKCIILMNI